MQMKHIIIEINAVTAEINVGERYRFPITNTLPRTYWSAAGCSSSVARLIAINGAKSQSTALNIIAIRHITLLFEYDCIYLSSTQCFVCQRWAALLFYPFVFFIILISLPNYVLYFQFFSNFFVKGNLYCCRFYYIKEYSEAFCEIILWKKCAFSLGKTIYDRKVLIHPRMCPADHLTEGNVSIYNISATGKR